PRTWTSWSSAVCRGSRMSATRSCANAAAWPLSRCASVTRRSSSRRRWRASRVGCSSSRRSARGSSNRGRRLRDGPIAPRNGAAQEPAQALGVEPAQVAGGGAVPERPEHGGRTPEVVGRAAGADEPVREGKAVGPLRVGGAQIGEHADHAGWGGGGERGARVRVHGPGGGSFGQLESGIGEAQ